MTSSSPMLSRNTKYHRNAFEFVFDALRYTQESLERGMSQEEESAHISGQELLEGIRAYGQEKYGLMATMVFEHWGVRTTEDFGKIVFELIERGEMRKTERDQLADFVNVYDFQEAFYTNYKINTQNAFKDR